MLPAGTNVPAHESHFIELSCGIPVEAISTATSGVSQRGH